MSENFWSPLYKGLYKVCWRLRSLYLMYPPKRLSSFTMRQLFVCHEAVVFTVFSSCWGNLGNFLSSRLVWMPLMSWSIVPLSKHIASQLIWYFAVSCKRLWNCYIACDSHQRRYFVLRPPAGSPAKTRSFLALLALSMGPVWLAAFLFLKRPDWPGETFTWIMHEISSCNLCNFMVWCGMVVTSRSRVRRWDHFSNHNQG